MSMTLAIEREHVAELDNPLGIDGIEFVEYATTKPQALGQALEKMGFHPVARHRSREVVLYRHGTLNIVVNADGGGTPDGTQPGDATTLSGFALRVRDASAAYKRALERGAWAVPTQVEVMELNIPAVHGVGTSRIWFVDRYKEFSIYDVDFVPIPGAQAQAAAPTGLHLFGIVQYIGNDRMEDWTEFYRELFRFSKLPDDVRFGVLPKGRVLKSPCAGFYLQLVEPEPGILEIDGDEQLARLGLGTADVMASVAELRRRGVEFVESQGLHSEARGALTRSLLDGVMFELVHDER